MDLLLDEYIYEYTVFLADSELNEKIYQLECGYVNESTGLISLNESVLDTIKEWFQKVLDGISEAVEKLKTKLANIIKEKIDPIRDKMNDETKPDPTEMKMTVTNYHKYDTNKLLRYTADKAFNSTDYQNVINGMVGGSGTEPIKEKYQILKSIPDYADLYDEKLNVFDKMRENILVSGKDNNDTELLTMDQLNECWEYCDTTYKTLIDSIEKDRDLVANQKKNVDASVQEILTKVQNGINNNNGTETAEESYMMFEAYINEADNDVKDEKVGTMGDENKNNGPTRETYAKAIVTYIQVVTSVISAKAKLTNRIFLDKVLIVATYARKNKWLKLKSEEGVENQG